MGSILTVDEALFGKSTIPYREGWAVIDSSKLQSLMGCPRGFFFSHILGWRYKEAAIHLAFGSGWHKAMEVIALKGTSKEAVMEAYDAFLKEYVMRMQMDMNTLEALHPAKTPSTAFLGLAEYATLYQDDPKYTMAIEIAGTAPIADNRLIHAKTDEIRRCAPYELHPGMIKSHEHKTAGRLTQAWRDQWSYYFQVGTYDHFLKCMYGLNEVAGVTINGAVFRSKTSKSPREFLRIPQYRPQDQWELWLVEANHWWDYYEYNMEQLYECSPDDRVMAAFPRNSSSCSKFGCSYPTLCSVVPNPLKRCGQVPFDMVQEYWDPRRREEEIKKVDPTRVVALEAPKA